jgi:hypothetical protein
MLLQVCAQQGFRDRDLVIAECLRSLQQARIARRELDVLRVRVVGAARITYRSKVIAQRAPCVRHVGFDTHCASQGCDRAFTVAAGTECQAELVVRSSPVGLRLRERLEYGLRCGRITGTSMCHAEQQRGERMPRGDLEDFRCLFGCESRLRGQQALRVSERGFQRSDRF